MTQHYYFWIMQLVEFYGALSPEEIREKLGPQVLLTVVCSDIAELVDLRMLQITTEGRVGRIGS